MDEYMPTQRGQVFELRDHQQEALDALELMRANHESIALLYHATLFLARTKEFVAQAHGQFKALWPEASGGSSRACLKTCRILG